MFTEYAALRALAKPAVALTFTIAGVVEFDGGHFVSGADVLRLG
jgi:hypothetical protein